MAEAAKKNQYARDDGPSTNYDMLQYYGELAPKKYRDARQEWFDAEAEERKHRPAIKGKPKGSPERKDHKKLTAKVRETRQKYMDLLHNDPPKIPDSHKEWISLIETEVAKPESAKNGLWIWDEHSSLLPMEGRAQGGNAFFIKKFQYTVASKPWKVKGHVHGEFGDVGRVPNPTDTFKLISWDKFDLIPPKDAGGKPSKKWESGIWGPGCHIISDQINAQPAGFKINDQLAGHNTYQFFMYDNKITTLAELKKENAYRDKKKKAVYVDDMDNVYDDYMYMYGYGIGDGHVADYNENAIKFIGYDQNNDSLSTINLEYALAILSGLVFVVFMFCICCVIGTVFGCFVQRVLNKAKNKVRCAVDEESPADE